MINRIVISFFKWTRSLTPKGDEATRLRTTIGMLASLMGIFFAVTFAVPLLAFGEPLAGWASLTLGVWMAAGILLFVWTNIAFRGWVYFNLSGLTLMVFADTLVLGGFEGSGGMILWLLLCPLLASILCVSVDALFWSFIFILCLITSLFLPEALGQSSSLPVGMGKGLFLFNASGISFFVLVIVQYFATQRNLYQERSDSLLLNILPREIADILRDEQRVIADSFEGASILFADVANFTPMSANMSPTELVELLNEVFSQFDVLVEKYGLEKIKTIGDCYMVASGIPRPRADHAQAATQMGLEILRFVQTAEFCGRKLTFRIGINSGPVVAGVIGQKKFAYDLWGDAVNTASRMESQGVGNTIQITQATYELIKDDFVCEPQKSIQVKGKGEMQIWHVVSQKA